MEMEAGLMGPPQSPFGYKPAGEGQDIGSMDAATGVLFEVAYYGNTSGQVSNPHMVAQGLKPPHWDEQKNILQNGSKR